MAVPKHSGAGRGLQPLDPHELVPAPLADRVLIDACKGGKKRRLE